MVLGTKFAAAGSTLAVLVLFPSLGLAQCKNGPPVGAQAVPKKPNPAVALGAANVGAVKGRLEAQYSGRPGQAAAPVMMLSRAPTTKVPDLKDKTLDQVRSVLGPELILDVVHDNNPQWIVDQQNPPPDHSVPICTKIELWMKAPPLPRPQTKYTRVPDIRPWPEAQIQSRLGDYHLTYGGTTEKESAEAPGTIFDQTPEPNTSVPWGTVVVGYKAIRVSQPPLQISLSASANSVLPGEMVTFRATLKPDLTGARYRFTFGDKTLGIESDSPEAHYAYENDGNYDVQVTAIVDGREERSQVLQINVHEKVITVTLEALPSVAKEGQPIEFRATVFPPLASTVHPEYVFDFGDKNRSGPSPSPSASHAYQAVRAYEASVTLLTEHGHRFRSNLLPLAIVLPPRPPWWRYVAIGCGLLAVLGVGGLTVASYYVTGLVSAIPRLGVGESKGNGTPGSFAEAEFGFRPMYPPADSSAVFQPPAITKIERLV